MKSGNQPFGVWSAKAMFARSDDLWKTKYTLLPRGNRFLFLDKVSTSHLSPLTSHLSPLTSHLPPLTSHLSLLTGTGSHLSSSAGTRARSFATHSGSVGKAARTRASRGAHSWQRENVCGRRQGMTVLDWLHQDNCFASPSKRSGSLSTAIDHSALRDFEGLSTDHVTNGWPWFAVVSNRYQQHSLSFTRVVSQVWDCDVDPATNEGAQ